MSLKGTWSAAAKSDTSAVKKVWSAPALIDEVRPADIPAKSQKQKASGGSKGGLRVSNASWGGGGRNLGWAAPAQVQVKVEPAKAKISNAGWGGAAKVSDTKKKVTKETSTKKEEKTKVTSSAAWSAPAKIKKVETSNSSQSGPAKIKNVVSTSTSSWSAPAKVPAPTICIESIPTPAPTTCDDRYSTWYYNINIGKCVNDDSMGGLEGEFDKLVECCGEYFIDTFCKYEDKCCSMNNHIWYYNVVANVCTNKADMTSNVGEWESDVECCSAKFEEYPCPVTDVCFPEPETILTAEPTMTPSAAPTSCENLYSTWYFDSSNGKCVSGMAGLGGEAFGSLDACCGAKYPDDEGFEYCLQYLNVDMCCLMKYDAWYYNSIEKVCTNDPGMVGNGNEEFDSESACCVVESGVFPCPSIDICIPVPPPPEILTGQPTGPEITTGEPTGPGLLTFAPTTPTTPENFETPFPSPAPSFGSTPTVSKETTGPPTFSRGGRE